MFNVLKGQSTEVFRRNKRNVAAAHERFCFSILYREMSPKGAVKERTLDLSAQGEIDFENWYYGLLAVVSTSMACMLQWGTRAGHVSHALSPSAPGRSG